MTFDIDGLSFNQSTGKASYETTLELWSSGGVDKNGVKVDPKVVFNKTTPAEVPALMGGSTRLPGDLHMIMGTKQAPGRYTLRLIVKDLTSKSQTYYDHPFNLLPQGFGLVGVTAPAIGFYGQHYSCGFALVNMGGLDEKIPGKPNVDIVMRILDQNGKDLMNPIKTFLPADLPKDKDGKDIDLNKENFLPMQFPIFLNRPGRFIVEIEAVDKIAKQQAKLRYNLTVVDVDTIVNIAPR